MTAHASVSTENPRRGRKGVSLCRSELMLTGGASGHSGRPAAGDLAGTRKAMELGRGESPTLCRCEWSCLSDDLGFAVCPVHHSAQALALNRGPVSVFIKSMKVSVMTRIREEVTNPSF